MRAFEWLHGVPLLWRGLVRRRDVEQELEDEFTFHRGQLIASYVEQGFSIDQAELAARRAMYGSAARVEACRDTWHAAAVDRLHRDLSFAWRRWRQTPVSTLAAVATLALTIGATAAIFSVVNGVLLTTPALQNADRIVWLIEQSPGGQPSGIAPQNLVDWRERTRVFERLVALTGNPVVLSDGTHPEQLRRIQVTPGYFEMFGLAPILGRQFTSDEDQPGREHVVILSHELWSTRFGADRGIVGRAIRLRGEPYEVVGVMGPEASGIHWGWAQLWTPLSTRPAAVTRSYHQYNAYGLLKPGISIDAARADMARVTTELAAEYPDTNHGWTATLQHYKETLVSPELKRSLLMLFAAVVAVLLIGCVNLANLTLTQGIVREREVAVRAALGGDRRRLATQLLTESIALGLVGGALGIVAAYAGIAGLRAMLPAFSAPGQSLPPADLVVMNVRVLAFVLVASVSSGILFGVVPALSGTRVDLQSFMKEAGAHATSPSRRRLRAATIVAQSALAFILLAATVGLTRELLDLLRIDIGRDPATVLTAQLPVTQSQALDQPETRAAYLDRLLQAARGTPGADDAALASVLPLMGSGSDLPFHPDTSTTTFDHARAPIGFFKMVTPSYFQIVGQPILRGRGFEAADTAASVKVALINDALARTYFAGVDPIGRRIQVPQIVATGAATLGPLETWQIVGVVSTERIRNLVDVSAMPGVYVPMAQSPTRHPALVVRARTDVASLRRSIEHAIATVNNDQPLTDVRTLVQIRDDYALGDRQRTYLGVMFGLAALLLAGIGVYGVSAASVAQQRRDIGVRAALGAPRSAEMTRIVGRALVLTTSGLAMSAAAAAMVGAVFPAHALATDRDGVRSMIIAAAALAGVAIIGSLVPAWRAAHVHPLEAIRQ